MNCIETHGLSYHFAHGAPVLHNINLKVPTGSIYGFLGPNGAGKTTTLKLIMGLLKNQEGSISVFGQPLSENRMDILQKTGSLIEAPSLYSHLTVVQNLEVLQKIYRCTKERIGAVLETLDLTAAANKKASQLSLGMKQRLSIAIALLHDPELLILDEPTNGLDPNGIIEIRALLQQLNRAQQITILVSSHLLSEVEKIATNIGIIHKGQLLFEGTLPQLQQQKQSATITFETNNGAKAMAVFQAHQLTPTLQHNTLILPYMEKEVIAAITRQLVYNGVDVYGIKSESNDLESIFIDLTAN